MNETVVSGKYFLGDPSFVLPNKIYKGIWGDLYHFRGGKHLLNGYEFTVYNTHYGNGKFSDTKNRSYEVESGFIGLVHMDLIENVELCRHGFVFNFKETVNFVYDAGTFYIKSGKKIITIDTRNLEEYDSEFEEHIETEDGENIGKVISGDSDTDSIIDENSHMFSSDTEDDAENIIESTEKFSFFKKK